jgi:hypothetical protein
MGKTIDQHFIKYLCVFGTLTTILGLSIVQILPAWAQNNSYPPWAGCDVITSLNGGQYANCTPSSGATQDYAQNNNGLPGTAMTYMNGGNIDFAQGQTVTLSGVSADVVGFLNVGSGSNENANIDVKAYLDDPNCSTHYDCALGNTATDVYFNTITYGNFYENGIWGATPVQYAIPYTSANYNVVFYVDASTSGSNSNTYSDFGQVKSPTYEITSAKVTETDSGVVHVMATDCNGNSINGMSVSLYNSNNVLVKSGYSPLDVVVPSAGTYTAYYDDYQSNTFVYATPSPPVTSYTAYQTYGQVQLNLPASGLTTVKGVYDTAGLSCSAPGGGISITSQDLSGNTLTGLYMQLYQGNTDLQNGWTPVTFNNLASGSYTVYANDYCNTSTHQQFTFNHWSDGTTSRGDTIIVSGSNVARTAYYSVGSC